MRQLSIISLQCADDGAMMNDNWYRVSHLCFEQHEQIHCSHSDKFNSEFPENKIIELKHGTDKAMVGDGSTLGHGTPG